MPKPPAATRARPGTARPVRVGLVASSDVFTSALCGMQEIFALADMTAERMAAPGNPPPRRFLTIPTALEPDIVGFAEIQLRLPLVAPRARFDVLVFLPAVRHPPRTESSPALVALARRAARQGTLVCSVCVGAFDLAHAGLLDGLEATTHWRYAPLLAERFPKVQVLASEMIVHRKRIITAAGLCAYLDLALYLVSLFHGTAVSRRCAQVLLIDTVRRKQSIYGDIHRVTLDPRDPAQARLADLGRWLDQRLQTQITVAEMARFCGLGERTFLRRFQEVMHQAPHAYLQGLRIERAKNLLASSSKKWSEIVELVGFSDESSFRRLFSRVVGVSPREFRMRAQNTVSQAGPGRPTRARPQRSP